MYFSCDKSAKFIFRVANWKQIMNDKKLEYPFYIFSRTVFSTSLSYMPFWRYVRAGKLFSTCKFRNILILTVGQLTLTEYLLSPHMKLIHDVWFLLEAGNLLQQCNTTQLPIPEVVLSIKLVYAFWLNRFKINKCKMKGNELVMAAF